MEIGTGKGTFLTEQAKGHPERNFLGVEYARWFWRYASDRLRRNQCNNARTVRAEAHFFFARARAQRKRVGDAHLFSGPLAEEAASQAAADSGEVYASAGARARAGGTAASGDGSSGLFEQIESVVKGSKLK